MSGTQIGVSTNNIAALKTNLRFAPPEGSKVLSVPLYWNALYFSGAAIEPIQAQLNLYQQAQQALFTKCQSVFIDNSSVPYPVFLESVESGQVIRVNAFTSGMYPLIAAQNPLFNITLFIQPDPNAGQSNGACTTTFHFLNTPQPFYENKPQTRPWTYAAQLTMGAVNNTPVLLTDTVNTGGNGLAGFGAPIYKRVKVMQFSITPAAALASVSVVTLYFMDQNGGANTILAMTRLVMQTGSAYYAGTWNLGDGAIQRNPNANFAVMFFATVIPAGGFTMTLQGYGDDVWIA